MAAKYRVGVIGLGRISSTIDDEVIDRVPSVLLPYAHTAGYREVPEVEVVAAADVLPDKRNAYRERWGVDALYADYREMLANEGLDIVSVCTRTHDRCDAVVACAEAGVKAILAEKPIAISLAEADTMVDACRSAGAALAINCSRRWHPWHQAARRITDEGTIGNVLNVAGFLTCQLSHNGSHLIDIVRYHAGNAEVEWVYGDMASDEAAAGDDDLQGNGYLHFSNGATGWIRATANGPIGFELDILGSAGRIRSLGNGLDWELHAPCGGDRLSGLAKLPFPRPQRIRSASVEVVYDLIDSIENGTPPVCSGDDGRAALEIAIALRESHRQRARIDLPLADRSMKMVPGA